MKVIKTLLVTAMLTASVSTVQADGFFGKIFGGAKSGANFETLMSHVPEDTAYILGNKKPIPDDVMDFHMKRVQDLLGMLSELDKDTDSDGEKKEGTAEDFMSALMKNLSDKLTAGKLEETGLTLEATSLLYGFESYPVLRLTFADKEKIMEAIKQAEEKSKYKVTLSKCSEFDCFIAPESDDKSAAIVITESHLAASFFPSESKEKMIAHLSGKSSPKNAYPIKKWDAFLKENGYLGYGDGYVDLQKVYDLAEPTIAKDMAKKLDEKEVAGCMAVIEAHAKNVPEVVFGIKTLDTKRMDYELLVKTSSGVSTVLQTLANKTNIAQRIDGPIIDMAFNLNFIKLRDGLTEYSNFLIKAGKDNGCSSIEEKEVRKGMGGLMMVMNMGLTQIKSLYVALKNIDLDERMMPKNIDVYASIGTEDPMGLLQMAGMFSPALMELKIPEDGSPVALPASAIPAKGLPLPPMWLSRSKDSLNIMVGNDKPTLKAYESKIPEIMSFALDGKRYYEKMAAVMSAIPQPVSQKDANKAFTDVMKKVGDTVGNYQQEIIADKRGLVFNYHITY